VRSTLSFFFARWKIPMQQIALSPPVSLRSGIIKKHAAATNTALGSAG